MGKYYLKPLVSFFYFLIFFAYAQEELIVKSTRLIKDKIVGAQTIHIR